MSTNRFIGYCIAESVFYPVFIILHILKYEYTIEVSFGVLYISMYLKHYFYTGEWPKSNPDITKKQGIMMIGMVLFFVFIIFILSIFNKEITNNKPLIDVFLYAALFLNWALAIRRGWKKYRASCV